VGGGTGSGRPIGERLGALEKIAKETLRGGSSPERHNVFISFDTSDLGEVNLLRGQAKNENSDIDFNDYSVKEPFDSNNADYIKRQIRERIRQSSVTIVYVSSETCKSRWVDWEIKESIRLKKGVVAMHKGNSPPPKLPNAIVDNRVKVVPWNHEALSKAVEQAATKRTGSM
jgi:hypothetical protein